MLHQTLEKHFTLHPELSPKNSQAIDDFYISEWASGYSAVAGYDARVITNDEVEQLFPVEDPELRLLYEQCIAFLADLGITAAEDTGYICRQNQKGNDYIIALLPYQIEGLTTEYKNQIVNRDSLQYSSKTGQHIMDYPWADFVFDCEGQLLKVEMSSFQVSSSKVLNGQVKHVTHVFRGQTVLKDITVDFDQGQIHGIVGNNGSGKTLLFKVMAGYLKPKEGEVIIDGIRLGVKQDFPSRLGMILETPGFLASEDAYTNLSLLWSLRGRPDREAIEESLKRVGLENVGRKHVGKFSLGMRQRLGIAQAIMESPKLLILDEPFNGLDKQGVQDIRKLLLSIKQKDVTMFISSHIPGDIDMLCDTVHEMENGTIHAIR